MNIAASIPDFDAPIVEHARQDFPLLDDDMTVAKHSSASGAKA